MKEYKGKSVFGGIAIGRIKVYNKSEQQVKRVHIDDTEHEKKRYYAAVDKAAMQLQELYDKAVKEVGEANAAIFEMHQIMLTDDDYKESVENIIDSQHVNAEYAVAQTGDNYAAMFAAMEDEYMRGRSADVKDISERLINILSGFNASSMVSDEPVIIVAEDLAPSETVQLDKDKILSFVSVKGSVNSHTAILARTMGIPALIGTPVIPDNDIDGKMGIVDGNSGCLYVDPDNEKLGYYRKKQDEQLKQKELLQLLKGREDITIDGRKIKLYANIGNVKDVMTVKANDAAGIGLFRSEFIYLERDTFPTEEEQFNIYRTVAENMAGKPVIIRTLDIGADKQCDYFNMDKEDNPALGMRAIRICLTRTEIFKTQLRALYRASAYGNINIMYPMIANMWEIDRIKEIEKEVRDELKQQGIDIGDVQTGIMIETPAAVMLSDELAEKVDFFSIGTNDLTQYTLAVDRQNPKLDSFFDPHHPAVLKMIKMVVDNAHKAGIWAGICGELGADTSLTREFLKMGVDELSVSPGRILPIRKIILDTDVSQLS
ncbi:MAG: phosphoenolpyruvate--protein phosphotransferase [Eubacterium sp.]|uniref:phosphoenolpyruvate--protein phosphotransferase n=1 Tax=Lachnospira sp. TaxID=2049031 RepID=UPI00033DBB11|nr:phosphoenolpyruvate--protein phosphotransferase [Eubacterium sp.]CDB65218.1 phosphoenolpyruvate-protein phosphotransferase [Eubacterium sp. CAG:248]